MSTALLILCFVVHVTSTEKVLRGAVRLSAAMDDGDPLAGWEASRVSVRQGGSLSI